MASVLAAELAIAGVLAWRPTAAVAGSPHPGAPPPAVAAPAAALPQAPPPAPPRSATPPPVTSAPPARDAKPAPAQRPGTIRLPGGGTATLVRKEVVGPNAVLPVPENLGEATWWGARLDAAAGASVFAGHVNWGGRVGPFAELWDARIGGPVTVADAAGKTWNFRIAQLVTLHKDELPRRADELFGQDGAHRIVLVTCGGRWLGGSAGYAENRVAIAEPT
ncbi:class F sortase [Amycolatopsis anabasis]|uniref:class F sortase n=1 Tax=Amycolatopsis anabasis TaxID=1840409 RepID=UPI001FEA458B|nr:class F sortase [Amycolatopsis anabasis]